MIVVFAAVAGLGLGLAIAVVVAVLVLVERPSEVVVVYQAPAPRVGDCIEATYRRSVAG